MTSLFSPLTLGGLVLPNRIAVAPMCQYSATGGCAGDWHLMHLGTLSASGAGLLVVEATGVEPEGRITPGCLGLYDAATEAALARVVAFCKAHGQARIGIQLAHAGRKASAQRPWEGGGPLAPDAGAWLTCAPSALPFGPGWHQPVAMTAEDLARVRTAHAEAAVRAARAGFDLVEIHAAHGYLLHQFLSPLSNRRADAYGGSAEARMRYPLEVVAAVREVWPAGRPLGVRITGADWLDGGLAPEDAVAFARALKGLGVDFVCVSSGGLAPGAIPPSLGPGYQVDLAARVRREAGIATRAVGLIATPEAAQAVLTGGAADFVALGRAFLSHPHWGWHAAQALGAELDRPAQYLRAAPKAWPGAAYR